MAFGEYMHYLLEIVDFKNPQLDLIDEKYRSFITDFLNSGLDLKSAKIYKEYEFVTEESHGIIDLLLEYENEVIIVDYKLKNIDDNAYNDQLKGYKTYIQNKLSKNVTVYLYSIIDSNLVKKSL